MRMKNFDHFSSKYADAVLDLRYYHHFESHSVCSDLRMEVGLLHTFYLYVKKCSFRQHETSCSKRTDPEMGGSFARIIEVLKGKIRVKLLCSYREHESCAEWDAEIGKICFRIEELLEEETREMQLPDTTFHELRFYRKGIKSLFSTDINESGINYLSDHYWLEDPEVLLGFIDKVLKDLKHFHHISGFERVKEKLKFLKCIIRFARLYDLQVGSQPLTDLLIHANRVTINAFYLISISWFGRYHEEPSIEILLQASQLIHEKIDPPSDPRDVRKLYIHVRKLYIHVLKASKLSSAVSALERDERLVAELITGLLDICTRIRFPITNQMQKLLLLLKITLKHHKEVSELLHETKDLIGAVFCDAAIVIFSISMNISIEKVLGETTDLSLFRLLNELEFISAKVPQVYSLRSVSGFGFPKTNELGSMDFLLQNLEELSRRDDINGSIALEVAKIKAVQEDLEFLRCFLQKIAKQHNQNEKLQTFWSRAMELAYRAELGIDIRLVGDGHDFCLDNIARDINLMKVEAQEMYDSTNYVAESKRVTKAPTHKPLQVPATTYNEDLVGLENEVKIITHRLTRGSMQLDIVPIVGMAGLGKTTLANKVYNAPSVVLYFHIRAWCTVSQVYNARTLIIQILCGISSEHTKQNLESIDVHDLTLKLKQVLLRNKYLLILDDLWDVEAWNLLVRSLPDDANGSRILITTRLQNLSLQFKPDSQPYRLRQLTDGECWELLQKKVFGEEGCPANLRRIGSRIAKSCRGLPLIVVLVAGILISTTQNCWEEVEKSLNFSTVPDNEYCMKTVDLSYSHLSDDLKSCLLYFSAFPEDAEILVRQQLLWPWISEGFVRTTTGGKNLLDAADDYLKALVDRSLVMVSKERTIGGCKSCKLHDLVYEFCVEKAKEEGFLHKISSWEGLYASTFPSYYYRVSYDKLATKIDGQDLIHFFPNLRSFWLETDCEVSDPLWDLRVPQLLRVFTMHTKLVSFPMEVVLLVHLRYLALDIGGTRCIPPTIANLSRLQTLILIGYRSCLLPMTIWNMNTLRFLYHPRGFVFPTENLEESPCLDHLDTLCLAFDDRSSQSLQKILTKLPSIRRLTCFEGTGTRKVSAGVPAFDCLSQLVSLKLHSFQGYGIKFPLNLKKLTLTDNLEPWGKSSVIAKLANLEVLKLHDCFAYEETWEIEGGDFPNLQFLKLKNCWRLSGWIFAFSDNFPRLKKLVVQECNRLKDLPSGLGECPNLEMIEVRGCRKSVAISANQIQEEQKGMGNEDLKVVIRECFDTEKGYLSPVDLQEEDAESSEEEEDEATSSDEV